MLNFPSVSGSKDGDNPKQESPRVSPRTSAATAYVPGGHIYQEIVATAGDEKNPRGGISVAQWLREWEQTWTSVSAKGKPKGQ